MTILGISAFYHDSAAALIQDGKIIAAAQEERFSRKKNDASFPVKACTFCLEYSGLTIDDLDAVVFYDKPFLKFERLLETYYRFAPQGIRSFLQAIPLWLKDKIFLKQRIRKELQAIAPYDKQNLQLLFTEHHLAHAASAFFASPFETAAILTIDGVGEWATASISLGRDNSIKTIKELHFPHSLGLLYSAFTYFLGFQVNGGEYKLMGLAPYGDAYSEQVQQFSKIIYEQLIDVKQDGSLWLNQNYFTYATGLKMVNNRRWEKLFGFRKRKSGEPIESHHCNLAFAIQQVTEVVVLKMAAEAKKCTGAKNLCMAGGVALNCVANGKILRSNIFEHIFVQPAAGDAGGALGAALATYYIHGQNQRIPLPRTKVYLGPDMEEAMIQPLLENSKSTNTFYEHFEKLCEVVAEEIAAGKVIGWFQGRMEFGPRALGNRSILADPRSENMQHILNLKIKNRESFRPFAPAVLEEDANLFFDLEKPSPHMLLVAEVNTSQRVPMQSDRRANSIQQQLNITRSKIPAVTHVDYSARVQTVNAEDNSKFYQLLKAFKKLTGYGLLINTSFNVKDEPIVCTPNDAYHCFMQTEMDILVIQNYLFKK